MLEHPAGHELVRIAAAGQDHRGIDVLGMATDQVGDDRSAAGVAHHHHLAGVVARLQLADRRVDVVDHLGRVVVADGHAHLAGRGVALRIGVAGPQQAGRHHIVRDPRDRVGELVQSLAGVGDVAVHQHHQHRMPAQLGAWVGAGLHLAVRRVDPHRLADPEPVGLGQDGGGRRPVVLGVGRAADQGEGGREGRDMGNADHDLPPQGS